MIRSIADFCPDDAEAGVGLALQDDQGRYLFFLAGTRHHCPAGERFYAGIGGHREAGEDWLACAHREALEETGTDVDILSAPITWHIPHRGPPQQVQVTDQPRPLAFYEMIHPPGTPRAGKVYRIVVYPARLRGLPRHLPKEEVLAILALTEAQVIRGPEHTPTLGQLLDQGAQLVASVETLDYHVRLYPLGTAWALSQVLRYTGNSPVVVDGGSRSDQRQVHPVDGVSRVR
jgi:8-oxo-dGTP pyrophosphatase MutT (NUDIX family)